MVATVFKRRLCLIVTATLCALAAPLSTAAVLIDFDISNCVGLPSPIGDYYAGGFDCAGVQGPDYGVTFTSGGVWPDGSGGQVLVFEQGIFIAEARLEMPAGFQDGIAFRISRFSSGIPFEVVLGNDNEVLLSQTIGTGAVDPDLAWTTIGLEFAGTATWLRLYTHGEIPADLDDLTLGSTTIVPIPAALWLLASSCLVLLGIRLRPATPP